ncbi:MAG: PHP domain-containing protein [Solobacterium sp.]|nr:PHP domain-containing protein [Solobacterium sp.]MBQ6592163.1 PHP domain-containing protein [Solobacterium sp.]
MFYDLHMHSCLSPCAEDEMTPNNICNMALIKGLEVIAVTDHNSFRQLPAVDEAARKAGIRLIYGAELESSEEVHMLSFFPTLEHTIAFQKWVDDHMPVIRNREDFFGHEWILNGDDEYTETEERLLLVSLDASLAECADAVHEYGGKCVLAHVLDRKNSVTQQLGFIPPDLAYDGLEIKSPDQKERVLKMHPWIKEDSVIWLCDSDAHRLIDISEAVNELPGQVLSVLAGREL